MSEIFSKEIFKKLNEGICVVNMEGEILYVNPAVCSLFNNTEVGMTGKNIIAGLPVPMIQPNDELIAFMTDSAIHNTDNHEAIVDFDCGDGNVRKLRVCTFCSEEYGGCVIYIFTDVTDSIRTHAAFERYMSKDVADAILHSDVGANMGGKYQMVTAIISDLRGFTAMSEKLAPNLVVKLLNHYFEVMVEIIETHNGVLDDFMGDGMLIEFGVPNERKTHADDALLCALEMQKAMADVNAWNREQGLPEIAMGIGINSGNAVVGNIGSRHRSEYTCIGRTINLASRIESLTDGDQILVSEFTMEKLSVTPEIKGTTIARLKGISRDVTVYDIVDFMDYNK